MSIDDFRAAITASGLGDPGEIITDGCIHRFRAEGDKPGRRNGWYVLHLNHWPTGAFGSWRLGVTATWCAEPGEELTPPERSDRNGRIKQAKRQRDAEQSQQHQDAAERAAATWRHAGPADPTHPYLIAKGVRPHGIRQQGTGLIVPVYVSGRLASIQTIYPNGRKRFLKGGRTVGGYCRIDDAVSRPEVIICEGFATGATLHEETGAVLYVAFTAGNLLAVANHARSLHPTAEVVIAADNDAWTEGNPGQTRARAAALAVGARLLVPDFTGMDTSGRPTDWNDWYRLRRASGRDAV